MVETTDDATINIIQLKYVPVHSAAVPGGRNKHKIEIFLFEITRRGTGKYLLTEQRYSV